MPQPLPFHRSLRLRDDDSSQAGASFVTICTDRSFYYVGRVVEGEVQIDTNLLQWHLDHGNPDRAEA